MENFTGKSIKEAGPSMPVVVLGWNNTPAPGQAFEAVSSKVEAEKKIQEQMSLGKPELFVSEEGAKNDDKKMLNLIIKTDVVSSLEAIDQALGVIKSTEVGFKVLSYGVGGISDGDIKMAIPSRAVVVGFYVSVDGSAKILAEREKIEIATFDIIYELVEKVREKMEAMLEPEIKKNVLGKVKILAIFKIDEKSQVVGGKVTSGKVKRGATIEVIRDSNPLMIGRLGQLQHNKADVEEVKEGLECGIRFDMLREPAGPMLPLKVGDVLEVYEEEKIKRSLG